MAELEKYLMGLDAGNTVIKTVLFDLKGNQVAISALDGSSRSPAPGHVERDLNELWTNAQSAIRDCITKAGIAPDQIIGLGCAGHRNGLYLLDTAGEPLLGIQSLDTRAAGLAAELAERNRDALHGICLQKPWPLQTPTLLVWVKRNRPETYAKAATAFLRKDFITYRLTGELVSDLSDMSGCGFTRMPDCLYDAELLGLYRLFDAADILPKL
ncbi:FGGY family carbohydrate kinase [Pseudorhodobacter sp.]|uniref:FGGY family carbohydrate kinase n=1 Tax=Pseudorhodobacter sp. TaxID=1934400 RepID=UPI002649067A|nr:FGGY family carbohydrate kinase [Pseudorhodobacter sp.]MDN5786921.1 hypothetical protein [Pseudorhodobacter sp.]